MKNAYSSVRDQSEFFLNKLKIFSTEQTRIGF